MGIHDIERILDASAGSRGGKNTNKEYRLDRLREAQESGSQKQIKLELMRLQNEFPDMVEELLQRRLR